jgi:hypothetical protein
MLTAESATSGAREGWAVALCPAAWQVTKVPATPRHHAGAVAGVCRET